MSLAMSACRTMLHFKAAEHESEGASTANGISEQQQHLSSGSFTFTADATADHSLLKPPGTGPA